MRISELKLHNFMNVANASLSFTEGLNVIGGANGMGKSVVLSAVAFCLTESKRGDSWKDFIKMGEKSMSIDMVLYKYEGDSPMVFEYKGDATSGSMTKTITYKNEFFKNDACATFLSSYFDMDMLENVVFHLQDSENVASLSPAKRRDLLKKIFSSDFSEISEKVKADITQIKSEISKKEADINALKSLKFEYTKVDSVPNHQIQKQIDSVNQIRVWANEIGVLRDLISSKKTVLVQAQQLSSSLTPQKTLLETQKKIMMLSISSLEISLPQKKNKLEETRKQLEIDTQQLAEVVKRVEEEKIILKVFKDNSDSLSLEFSEAQKNLSDISAKVLMQQKQLLVFNTEPTCPTCGQECSLDHVSVLEKDIEKSQAEKTVCQKLFDDIKSKRDLNTTELNKSLEGVSLLEKKEITQKGVTQTKTNEISSLEREIANEETRLQEVVASLKQIEENLNVVTNQLADNAGILDTIPITNAEIQRLDLQIMEKTKQIDDLKNEVHQIESMLLLNAEREKNNLLLQTQEKETGEKIQTNSQFILQKANEITDLEYVKKVYDTELPNHIMMKACALLENEMNSFLTRTKEGFLCRLTQNAKGIEFFYKARNEPDWLKAKMASGFEALLLTVAFKVSVASAYNTKILVFDEIDKTATEQSSLKLFESIVSVQGFEQMFVITHRPKSLGYLKEMGAKVIEANNGEFTQY